MSQRSLVEINHDFHPGTGDAELAAWARKVAFFINSGDARYLPDGVTLKHRRHHSEPCPMDCIPPGPAVGGRRAPR